MEQFKNKQIKKQNHTVKKNLNCYKYRINKPYDLIPGTQI